ncbi:SIR2 family NAD-dependent protein deacylase [Orenia marismortui]|uniref:SIR2-like protein n=1 Tax=Orenia marismortui TaxID=46469 RepID=A0A4R8H444_9FIRM|nr:SIR2 family protein [Orenia marismortui]TDX51520.1 SIR2-like protein [Orenia marismortui]
MSNYSIYQENVKADILNLIEVMECLPILFIGSGISKRYFEAPNWDELLTIMADQNPFCRQYAYYKQNYIKKSSIGSQIAKEYSDWAWGDGNDFFDKSLYSEDYKLDVFLKYKIAEYLKGITPSEIEEVASKHQKELKLLQQISPHAIITTNYDTFLQMLFPEYEAIIGQQILRTQYQSIGEIFKIHGCVSSMKDIILTEEDYDEFIKRKKYLTAKLLTYFLEHPIFIFGYSVTDSNIKAILSDIDEILVTEGELVPNIFLVEYRKNIDENANYPSERLINLENGKSLRIKTIVAKDFDWIYETMATDCPIEKVNPKLLRALLSRTYELIRTDVPRRTVEIDYAELRSALHDKSEIGKIYGITTLTNPSAFNLSYPYSLTDVGKAIGYNNWHSANDLIEEIKRKDGVCIKESDNKYHIAIMNGDTLVARKYSEEMVSLLKKVKNNEPYNVEL